MDLQKLQDKQIKLSKEVEDLSKNINLGVYGDLTVKETVDLLCKKRAELEDVRYDITQLSFPHLYKPRGESSHIAQTEEKDEFIPTENTTEEEEEAIQETLERVSEKNPNSKAKIVGITQLGQMRFRTMAFEGKWKQSFGTPEYGSTWCVWGNSGNGKTEFCLQLAKYFTNFGKVLYLSREQGISSTIQIAFDRNNMDEVSGKLVLGEGFDFYELLDYLEGRNKANIVFIDSLDYMRLTTDQYKIMTNKFPTKTFVIVAWASGKEPKSQYAKDIRFMADVKIYVEGFATKPASRFGGNEPYIIWEDGAIKTNPAIVAESLFTPKSDSHES